MIVAVGSQREPKVEAVRNVFTTLSQKYPDFHLDKMYDRDIPSGTLETPSHIRHLMDGSYNRVQALRRQLALENLHADLYIGLEGGVHQIMANGKSRVFLQSWVYVAFEEQGFYGSSGNLPLPDSIADAIYSRQRSLGKVIDEFSGKTGVRDNEGTFGILTGAQITRRQSFEIALLSALAPIYNRKIYQIELKTNETK